MTSFQDRTEAGRLLAAELAQRHFHRPVVLALPRGGVPVAFEVAQALKAPLDLVMVRKVGVPSQPELAAAAVVDGESPEVILNDDVVSNLVLAADQLQSLAQHELQELERRRALYLRGRKPVDIRGCTAIIVDDGLATGTTARAAIRALRRRQPERVVLAIPVAPPDTANLLASEADEVVCLKKPDPFRAVGLHYRQFDQVSDAEVQSLMKRMDTAEQDTERLPER